MSKPTPAAIAHEVYEAVVRVTESFADDRVGVDLCYLLGAIVDPSGGGLVDWSPDLKPEPPRLLALLRENFAAEHPVWKHIRCVANIEIRLHFDGVTVTTTLDQFLRDNAEEIGSEERAKIEWRLLKGQGYWGGGGAAPAFKLEAV